MGLASALSTALTGLSTSETMISVAGNNISNSTTDGFKQSQALFTTQFLQTMSLGSSPSGSGAGANGGTNPQQIGLGTQVAEITPDFSQGTIQVSSSPSDLAIQGDGFFIVQGNTAAQEYTATERSSSTPATSWSPAPGRPCWATGSTRASTFRRPRSSPSAFRWAARQWPRRRRTFTCKATSARPRPWPARRRSSSRRRSATPRSPRRPVLRLSVWWRWPRRGRPPARPHRTPEPATWPRAPIRTKSPSRMALARRARPRPSSARSRPPAPRASTRRSI